MKTLSLALAAALLLAPLVHAGEEGKIDEKTKTAVRAAIDVYVAKDVALKEKFLLLDPRTDAPLALAFDHVHDGVQPHDGGYRACVDFTDAAGTRYDVDVVVSLAGEEPEVREVFLHKIGGEPVARE